MLFCLRVYTRRQKSVIITETRILTGKTLYYHAKRIEGVLLSVGTSNSRISFLMEMAYAAGVISNEEFAIFQNAGYITDSGNNIETTNIISE